MHAMAQKSNQEIITLSTEQAWKNIWLDLKGGKEVELEWVLKQALTGPI